MENNKVQALQVEVVHPMNTLRLKVPEITGEGKA
jgi:hypothetical protein